MAVKKAKTSLASGEGIAKVLTLTSQGNVYEAEPNEVANVATPPTVLGALVSNYQLEQSSSPAFAVNNRGAAELYQSQMGGYMMLPKNGKVYAAKLNPADWDKFADGTPVADASLFETMVHVPPCNFKAENTLMHFGGITPVDGGHTFDSPEWVGAYKMYVDGSGAGHSRPDVAPAHRKSMSGFWYCAQKLGTKWGLANYGFFCLINALYQARYGNLNSQETIGAGFQTSSWEAARDVPMGKLKKLGDGSGNVFYTDATIGDQYPVKLFGFEDLWGKLWEFRSGIRFYMDGTTRKAVVYSGNLVSNTATGREFECAVKSTPSAYVKNMQLGEFWDMIAQNVTGAGSTTNYTDAYWAAESGELLIVGGPANGGAVCGVAYAASDDGFSVMRTSLGSRLAFYGTPEIVSGADLVALVAS